MKPLSQKEQQIMLYIILGYSNGKIAEKLNYSIPTVNQYVRFIFRKLQVENRVQAVIKWFEIYKKINLRERIKNEILSLSEK